LQAGLEEVETDLHIGLRADDLIPEENDTVQLALKRLPPKDAYDRVFRLRRAFQVWQY
jgi:ubiquinol-cytochrome c reductase subunit 7